MSDENIKIISVDSFLLRNDGFTNEKLIIQIASILNGEKLDFAGSKNFICDKLGYARINSDLESSTRAIIKYYNIGISYIFEKIGIINKNLSYIEHEKSKHKKDDFGNYKFKKLLYFEELNKNLANKILSEMRVFLISIVKKKLEIAFTEDLENITYFENMWDECDNIEWLDPLYNFDVLVKFSYPSAQVLDFPNASDMIEMKKRSVCEYYNEVEKLITKNNLLNGVCNGVKNNDVIKNKTEIFEVLCKLFELKKYDTFCVLGLITVEGLFNDYCTLFNGREPKESENTIHNKVDKVFKNNKIGNLIYTPYFKFDFAILRNEVAHKGFLIDDNIKYRALDIILDLFVLIQWINFDMTVPYNNLSSFFLQFQLNNLEINHKNLFNEIRGINLVSFFNLDDFSVCNLIKNKEHHKAKLQSIQEGDKNLYEIATVFHDLIFNIKFWNIVKDHFDYENNTLKTANLSFYRNLCKEFIGKLEKNSDQKRICIYLNKALLQ